MKLMLNVHKALELGIITIQCTEPVKHDEDGAECGGDVRYYGARAECSRCYHYYSTWDIEDLVLLKQ